LRGQAQRLIAQRSADRVSGLFEGELSEGHDLGVIVNHENEACRHAEPAFSPCGGRDRGLGGRTWRRHARTMTERCATESSQRTGWTAPLSSGRQVEVWSAKDRAE